MNRIVPHHGLDAFLERRLMAHLATVADDGARESPVWFLWEDDVIWILANREQRTVPDRIEREPNCAIGIVDFDPETGELVHVGLRGRATVEPLDPDRAERLLERYLRSDKPEWGAERFGDPQEWGDEMVFVRLDPESIVVRDQPYAPAVSR